MLRKTEKISGKMKTLRKQKNCKKFPENVKN